MLCLLSIAITYFSWQFIGADQKVLNKQFEKQKDALSFRSRDFSFLMFGLYAYINDGLQNRAKILIGDIGLTNSCNISIKLFVCEDKNCKQCSNMEWGS